MDFVLDVILIRFSDDLVTVRCHVTMKYLWLSLLLAKKLLPN